MVVKGWIAVLGLPVLLQLGWFTSGVGLTAFSLMVVKGWIAVLGLPVLLQLG